MVYDRRPPRDHRDRRRGGSVGQFSAGDRKEARNRRERSQLTFGWRRGVRIMRIAPLADVKARLSAYLDECGVEGPVGHYAQWRLMLGHSPRFQALLDRSRQSIKEGKGLAEEALWGGRSQTSASTKGR